MLEYVSYVATCILKYTVSQKGSCFLFYAFNNFRQNCHVDSRPIAIKRRFTFSPYLSSASAHYLAQNTDIASFHWNAVCCFAVLQTDTQYTLKLSPGNSWTILQSQNDAPNRTKKGARASSRRPTHTLNVQEIHGVRRGWLFCLSAHQRFSVSCEHATQSNCCGAKLNFFHPDIWSQQPRAERRWNLESRTAAWV